MDEKIEKVLALAGNNNRYQYFTLVIMVFLWINCNIIAIILPYIERAPLVNYTKNGKNYTREILTSELCTDLGDTPYEIDEEFDYSWPSEFHMECDKVKIGLIGSFAFIGNTAGGVIFSFITKFLSHKNILIISSFGYCIAIFLSTLVKSKAYFQSLLICEVFIGLFGNCLCYSSLVVAQEIVAGEKRSLFSSIINVGYSLCGVLYSFAFYFAQKWRIVFYILIISSLVSMLLIWIFVYDSPRGYINNRDYKNTMRILEGIAHFNGKLEEFRESIKEEEFQSFINELKGENSFEIEGTKMNEEEKEKNTENDKTEKTEEKQNTSVENIDDGINEGKSSDASQLLINPEKKFKIHKITFFSLFKYPSIRYKFVILNFLWIGTRLAFNGIAISSKSFPGNFYVNIIISYIVETISYVASGYLIDIKKLGRKGTLWIQYALSIISFILLLFDFPTAPTLIFNFIARFAASGIDVIYYTYSIELYPTPVRSIAFGVNATFGNAGSILAPMLLEFLPKWLLLLILASICFLNSFFIMFLPETVGKPMIETIDELEKKETE